MWFLRESQINMRDTVNIEVIDSIHMLCWFHLGKDLRKDLVQNRTFTYFVVLEEKSDNRARYSKFEMIDIYPYKGFSQKKCRISFVVFENRKFRFPWFDMKSTVCICFCLGVPLCRLYFQSYFQIFSQARLNIPVIEGRSPIMTYDGVLRETGMSQVTCMIQQRQLRLLRHVARFPGSNLVSRVIS